MASSTCSALAAPSRAPAAPARRRRAPPPPAAAAARAQAAGAGEAAPPLRRSQVVKLLPLLAAAAALPAAAAAAPAAAPAAAAPAAAAAAAPAGATPAAAAAMLPEGALSRVMLETLADCRLAVSAYPEFAYNAAGGGGAGTVTPRADGLLDLDFDAAALRIPAVQASTARVLGVPIPPPLRIAIRPRSLRGTLDPATGVVRLDFDAEFEFTAGALYAAPPLQVSTTLTTERTAGAQRAGEGRRLGADGRATLVGVARVPRTGDGLIDGFLMLPADALAVLSAELHFS
jgi:hypothetical protein